MTPSYPLTFEFIGGPQDGGKYLFFWAPPFVFVPDNGVPMTDIASLALPMRGKSRYNLSADRTRYEYVGPCR